MAILKTIYKPLLNTYYFMKNKIDCSPLPWEAKDVFQASTDEILSNGNRIALVVQYDSFGNLINNFHERKENAKMIVEAVNNYTALQEERDSLKKSNDELKKLLNEWVSYHNTADENNLLDGQVKLIKKTKEML